MSEKEANNGLTPDKVIRDRQNAFDIGIHSYIESAGMRPKQADVFRDRLRQGLSRLSGPQR